MNKAMMNKLKKMQKEIEQAQEDIRKSEYTASYQGISISMLGSKEVTRVNISNPELLEDKDMLEELLQVAINACIKKVDDAFEEAMSPYASLMGGLSF